MGGIVLMGMALANSAVATASDPIEVGYRDFSYASAYNQCNSTPTGEKSESKLWVNDRVWWGSLCNPVDEAYHIYRFDLARQSWIDTGTVLDNRASTKSDVLWDEPYLWHPWLWRGTPLAEARPLTKQALRSLQQLGLISKVTPEPHLYVVSHIFTSNATFSGSPMHWSRLYRYSYDSETQTYSLGLGFPVYVSRGKSETLTISKDSTGQLWVAYVEDKQVMLNHSNTSDLDWESPFVLPAAAATNLGHDDIAAVVAFDGRVGVMWSNQNTNTTYFATHRDGTAENNWEVVSVYTHADHASDDHIDLKVDAEGNLFAVIKTSFTTPEAPLIVLLKCPAGTDCSSPDNWQDYTVYQVKDNHTRPTTLIDIDNRQLHIFTANSGTGGRIERKVTSLDNIQFLPGPGEPFIWSLTDNLNNPTSTKQFLTSQTGLLLLASDKNSRYYYHNYMSIDQKDVLTTSYEPTAALEQQ